MLTADDKMALTGILGGLPAPSVYVRWLVSRDMPEVLAIEHASFDFPRCEEDFLASLRQRNCIGMVAQMGERILGFMLYQIHKSTIDVLDFAVHPKFRRQGVGCQMVDKLVGKLTFHRRTRIVISVRETNLAGLLFFRGRSFRAVKVLREHYRDTGEDAFVMAYTRGDRPRPGITGGEA